MESRQTINYPILRNAWLSNHDSQLELQRDGGNQEPMPGVYSIHQKYKAKKSNTKKL